MVHLLLLLLLVFLSVTEVFPQGSERLLPIDLRIDSILLSAPDVWGLQSDALAEESLPEPMWLGPAFPGESGPDDLMLFDRHRELPAYTRSEGFVLYVGNHGRTTPLVVTPSLRLRVSGGIGFAFALQRWQGRCGAELELFDRQRPVRLLVEGHDLIDSRESWKVEDPENSVAALVAGVDTRDLYAARKGGSVSLDICPVPTISIGATVSMDDYGDAPRRVGWSIFGPPEPFADGTAPRSGRLRSITPRIAVGSIWNGEGDGSGMTFGLDARMEFGSIEEDTFQQITIDARSRWWPMPGHLALSGHGRVIRSDGDIPAQRALALGGFGTITAHPLNAYRLRSGVFWVLEALIRIPADAPSDMIDDLAVIMTGEWCSIDRDDRMDEVHGGLGIYIGTATGRIRVGLALPTDGAFAPRMAIRLSRPM